MLRRISSISWKWPRFWPPPEHHPPRTDRHPPGCYMCVLIFNSRPWKIFPRASILAASLLQMKASSDWRRWRLHLSFYWLRLRKALCASDHGRVLEAGKRLPESHPELRPFALRRITRSDLTLNPEQSLEFKDGHHLLHIIYFISKEAGDGFEL